MILTPEDPHQLEFSCRADLLLEEPLIKTIAEVVDRLDLSELYSRYSEAGRSFYDPAMMLQVLFFGYCDSVRSSRELAKHVRYDVRYRYYCGSLRPDFRTINRFRKDNLDFLSVYFAQIVLLCQEHGLVDASLLALDGTKIRASASGHDQLQQRFQAQLGEDITSDSDVEAEEPKPELEEPREEKATFADPDARFMKSSEGGIRLSYNSQIVVDKNQVIVAADVSNCAADSVQFKLMLEQSRQMLGEDFDKVTADGGYYSGNNLKYAASGGIDLYLPVTKTGRVPYDRFHRDAFIYDKLTDSYRCPAGQNLPYRNTRVRRGVRIRVYVGSVSKCSDCASRSRCTTGRYRQLEISENYCYEQEMKTKLKTEKGKEIYNQRKQLVEPVFGNIKFNLGFMRFALRTLAKVKGEFLLICIAHNLKKMAAHGSEVSPTFALKMVVITHFSWCRALLKHLLRQKQPYQIDFSNMAT